MQQNQQHILQEHWISKEIILPSKILESYVTFTFFKKFLALKRLYFFSAL